MVIVVLWGFLGIFYWCCFVVGQVALAGNSPKGTRLKRSAIYWLCLCAAVGASFANTWAFVLFGAPVLVILSMPIVLIPGAYDRFSSWAEMFTL